MTQRTIKSLSLVLCLFLAGCSSAGSTAAPASENQNGSEAKNSDVANQTELASLSNIVWGNEIGDSHQFGYYGVEIKNNSNAQMLVDGSLKITAYDKDGNEAGSCTDNIPAIGPGNTFYYGGDLPLTNQQDIDKVEMEFVGGTLSDNNIDTESVLEVSNTSADLTSIGILNIAGDAKNVTDKSYKEACISTVLTKGDEVVAIYSTSLSDDLDPGKTVPFTSVSLGEQVPDYDQVTVYAYPVIED